MAATALGGPKESGAGARYLASCLPLLIGLFGFAALSAVGPLTLRLRAAAHVTSTNMRPDQHG
ncbi:hypothetical protein GCM10018966_067250 [Streptomyces yanii]